ncbi:hypothetical protein [Nostoc sp.]|uniref:hypothetical protein n=1 Tax=Nostoc sp. TaxID=1180 RepID=UPI002FF9FE74
MPLKSSVPHQVAICCKCPSVHPNRILLSQVDQSDTKLLAIAGLDALYGDAGGIWFIKLAQT